MDSDNLAFIMIRGQHLIMKRFKHLPLIQQTLNSEHRKLFKVIILSQKTFYPWSSFQNFVVQLIQPNLKDEGD